MLQRDVLKRINNMPDNTNKALSDLDNSKASKAVATSTTDGLLSAEDKAKLNTIETNANYYEHPSSHPASMITGLSNVAKSGLYSDLTGVPTKLSQFENNQNFVTQSQLTSATHTHANKAVLDGITETDIDNWNDKSWGSLTEVPTTIMYEKSNISKLTNDANYVTNTQMNQAIQEITGVDGKNLHVHTNLPLLETITEANWKSKINVATKSLTTSNWTRDTDGLYSATVTHNLATAIQDITVRNTDGDKLFVDFKNDNTLNSITITTTKAYNAEVELMYAVEPATL